MLLPQHLGAAPEIAGRRRPHASRADRETNAGLPRVTGYSLLAQRIDFTVGTPFGETVWQPATAKRLGWESTLRPPGRPKRRRPDR